MPLDTEAEIGLLIGANCPRAIKPHEVILGNDDDPYAKRTALGWGIIGEIEPQGQDNSPADVKGDVFCNHIVTCEVRQAIQATSSKKVCHFALKTQVKEVLNPLQMSKMFTLDFSERVTKEKFPFLWGQKVSNYSARRYSSKRWLPLWDAPPFEEQQRWAAQQ